jgi:crossover junction endodeoxyribonuclease RusA
MTIDGKAWRIAVCNQLIWKRVQRFERKDSLQIQVWARPPDNRRRDLDNLLKPLLDALVHSGVVPDDSQFDMIQIFRGLPVKNGSLCVVIEKI